MRRVGQRRGPRRASPRLSLYTLFALGLAFVHVFGLGHLVFVSHTICEHGALLHAHAEAAVVGEEGDRERGAAAQAPSFGDHHQHCDPFAVRTTVPAVLPAFAAPALLAWIIAPEAAASPLAHAPISVLALAPKSSPPALRSSPQI